MGRLLLLTISVVLLGLLGRVWQLQHRPAAQIEAHAGRRDGAQPLLARRGALLDRRGRALAISRVGHRLFVDPALIGEDRERNFALHLAHAVGGDPARIDMLIDQRRDSRYVVIDKLLPPEKVFAAQAFASRAVGVQPVAVREYPYGELAGQLLGFVGADHTGLDGMELLCDSPLRGTGGTLAYRRDATRRPLAVDAAGLKLPEHGADVRLSIDAVVQDIAERTMHQTCTLYQAKRGEAVVMDARSGQVLAMVNWPSFAPAAGGNVQPALRRNRCVTDPYEPGSIFKPFVHAAATELDLARPDEMIECTDSGFYVSPQGRRLRDARGHGTISWAKVLIESSNIGMAIVGQRMGVARMHAAVRAFGFGSATGVGLPGESVGIVNPLNRWNHYSQTSVPMGQEIAVTPIQMARAFAAFANQGMIPTPTVFADRADRPIYQRAIGAQVADATRRLLRRVVTEGTGRKAQSDKYRIWGKTGTAQVADRVNGGFLDDAYTASFVCGAPLNRPRLIVIVVVHQPDRSIGYYGGTVAAPAARQIVEQSLEYLGEPHDADIDADDQTGPSRVAARD